MAREGASYRRGASPSAARINPAVLLSSTLPSLDPDERDPVGLTSCIAAARKGGGGCALGRGKRQNVFPANPQAGRRTSGCAFLWASGPLCCAVRCGSPKVVPIFVVFDQGGVANHALGKRGVHEEQPRLVRGRCAHHDWLWRVQQVEACSSNPFGVAVVPEAEIVGEVGEGAGTGEGAPGCLPRLVKRVKLKPLKHIVPPSDVSWSRQGMSHRTGGGGEMCRHDAVISPFWGPRAGALRSRNCSARLGSGRRCTSTRGRRRGARCVRMRSPTGWWRAKLPGPKARSVRADVEPSSHLTLAHGARSGGSGAGGPRRRGASRVHRPCAFLTPRRARSTQLCTRLRLACMRCASSHGGGELGNLQY